MEIIDSIEKFDAAFSNRSSPTKGLEKYINDQSRVDSAASTNKPHRMRAYYVAEGSDFYWLLSRYQEAVDLHGIAGTGMNPGLKAFLRELIANANLIKIISGEFVLELLDSQGNPLPEDDLDKQIIPMAISWVGGDIMASTSVLAGKSESFNLVGRTSDGHRVHKVLHLPLRRFGTLPLRSQLRVLCRIC